MSAWVIALGLSAGYLINKNVTLKTRLQAVAQEANHGVGPATDGPPVQTIRKVQRTVPDADKYEEINRQDLKPKDQEKILEARSAKAQEVRQYEAPKLPEIEGVYLMRGF